MSVALNDAVILTELLGGGGIRGKWRRSRPSPTANGKNPAAEHSESSSGSGSDDDDSVLSSSSASVASSSSDSDGTSRREVCNLEDWWEVRNRLEEWHWRRKGVGTCVNVLAMALYTLFGAEGAPPWPCPCPLRSRD